ncbi:MULTISPECIES: hypothetical protein [Vibrio]|uniref:Uncharacterized protein n=2 Tax=Vibrio campbellii TaxID=680 RepID=A0AAE9N4G7_9VIBR|nr:MULTISPECIES: hypothetical protein [Vibrio]EJG2229459.1 hypothetical protein [Vibrio parahaemolyticus]ABU72944.1 hypothetical protein VIBHAR_05037 [Vibrio campbellii ATCC BAA-1116]AGU98838.1 hypothetical protein M892_26015 [Vibrio campbellii ATCC BAA-1116]ARV74977.1 hypothetical protein A8140_20340 [Vibrio campbellii CAIM 519 = NBRC 15631 = ATCC 25920]ELB2062179.1 hypothetical protein [Vibrio parahaemolyticus]|tara:strand:- start:279 stop:515 length:237 start_codon:yes stop_codon:yes gene_type:complete
MDPTWLSALVALATLLVMLTGALIGKLFSLSKELADYKTHVAESYATKEEVKDGFERLERQLETGLTRIYETLKREAA